MNQQAIDQIKAERDELRKRAAWYEELRTATDGGSESMTHEDAIEHVLALAAENKVLREDAARYRWLSTNAYVGIAPHPKPHEVWCLRLPQHLGCNNLDAAIDAALTKEAAK